MIVGVPSHIPYIKAAYHHVNHQTRATEEGHIKQNALLAQEETNTEGRGTHEAKHCTEGLNEKKQLVKRNNYGTE